MAQSDELRTSVIKGAWFQMPMIFVWAFRYYAYSDFTSLDASLFTITDLLRFVGLALMMTCLLRIYVFNSSKELITSDVFALTRHPMYHGMFIADAALFFSTDLTNPLVWISWIAFVALLLIAGWYQEKETLARWGTEAQEYYNRTPRFIFEWLLRFKN